MAAVSLVQQYNNVKHSFIQYDCCKLLCGDLLPLKPQAWDKTLTFLNVLVELVNKSVQLLPLLGRELQSVTGVNPLTEGTEIKPDNSEHQKNRSDKDELRSKGECSPRSDSLSIGSHKREEREETLWSEPLQKKHSCQRIAKIYFHKVEYSINWACRKSLDFL